MKTLDLHVLASQWFKRPWWVKIQTRTPSCTYYFGPFDNQHEAKQARWGYMEDLLQEGAEDLTVKVGTFQPQQLTIDHQAD